MKETRFAIDDTFEGAVSKLFGEREIPESTSTVLRYPGGKTQAVETIREYFPDDITALCSPFLGGASIEIACAADGIEVYGSDAFQPVVNFWNHALHQPMLLSERVKAYHPLSKDRFCNLQHDYDNLPDNLEKAAVFFVLNRSLVSEFDLSAIDQLRDFKSSNLFAECLDYKDALSIHEDKFLYLKPPHVNEGTHEEFKHEDLVDHLNQRDGWILSCNDCSFIRDLYSRYHIVKSEWTEELLVVNV